MHLWCPLLVCFEHTTHLSYATAITSATARAPRHTRSTLAVLSECSRRQGYVHMRYYIRSGRKFVFELVRNKQHSVSTPPVKRAILTVTHQQRSMGAEQPSDE